MQTTLKVCKLILLLCFGLSTKASPILTGLKTIPSDYQQSGSPFHQEYSFSSNPNHQNFEIQPNVQPPLAVDNSLKNAPSVTTTFIDQNGHLVKQVKKEIVNNNNGQHAHALEFEETKQLPNGYSKTFKKEYSSSSAIQPQSTTFVQKPLTVDKYYNSQKSINGDTSQFGQYSQNYQGSLVSDNSDYFGIKSNLKPTIGESMTNVPAVTSIYKDQNGNLVTQMKKETVNNNNGQNAHVLEIEETKQLPNGYSKTFKKEYSSSSAIQSQPTTFFQKPLTVDKYYNSQKPINGDASQFGQYSQNYQGSLVSDNSDYFGIKSNLKPTIGESMTNVPAVTSIYKDQNGNLVTQMKKETVNNNNGQNSHVLEIEETKQLPNGYSKSFKKEYSSSSAIQSQPTAFVQKSINGDTSQFGQYSQNYQGSLVSDNSDSFGIKSNLKPTIGESMTNVPAVTSIYKDQNGNLVTQMKKETVNNNNGQNSHVLEIEETKQLPNGYSKSFKKEYSSSSVIGSYPTNTEIKTSIPQKFTTEELEKFNGYNTFFNNQKQPLNPNGPLNSQIINDKKTTYAHDTNKANSFGYNIRDHVDCDESESSSSSHQLFKQQPVNLNTYSKPSLVNQQSVNINLSENIGQESADLHSFSKPSPIGQESVNIDNLYTSKKPEIKPTGLQFEKFESSYQNKYSPVGQQPVNINSNSQSSQQYGTGQQIISQPTTGQQTQGLEFLTSNYGDTTHLLDLGTDGQKHTEYIRGSTSGQQNVNNEKLLAISKPIGQKAFSTYTKNIGQESVDLNSFSKPSSMGQESVNIDNIYTPNKSEIKPKGQHQTEKFEFSSTQTENVGQESVDLHSFSKPPLIGQESVNIDNLYNPNKPDITPTGQHQTEKFEFSSTQTENVGQESVDLHSFSKPPVIGQESVNIDNLYNPNKPDIKPTGQHQTEKLEFSSKQTQNVGQESVDLHSFSKSPLIGQESVNIDNLYNPNKPDITPTGQHQFEKFEFSSTQTENVGQESVDLHSFSKPSVIGQESINIDNLYKPNKPDIKATGQHQTEKLEFSSKQTQKIGQESIDLHAFSKPPLIGQEFVNIDNLYNPNKPNIKPTGQHQTEKFEFSSSKTENIGQESVDLNSFSKPSSIGQESVNIDNIYTPNKPEIKPTELQFEKLESSYQNKYSSVGQQPVNMNSNSQSSQQYGTGQQIISQPTTGQQIQGLEFLTSNYGDTTHLLDLGIGGQKHTEYIRGSTSGQQNVKNEKLLTHNKPIGQQAVVFERQSILEKNIDSSSLDNLPTNFNNNYQTLHGQSMKSPTLQGQQTIEVTSDFEGNKPTHQNHYRNDDTQKSEFFSQTGKLNTGKDQSINFKYNSVFDKLGQLEHEILAPKSTVNINKDNFQTSYSTNHNLKSMPQTSQQVSSFSRTFNENTQYIEPQSEIIVSSLSKKETESVVHQDTIEDHKNFMENPTTQPSVWKKFGDKVKGTIQNAKNKAQQLASTLNDKVGFSKNNDTENPC